MNREKLKDIVRTAVDRVRKSVERGSLHPCEVETELTKLLVTEIELIETSQNTKDEKSELWQKYEDAIKRNVELENKIASLTKENRAFRRELSR